MSLAERTLRREETNEPFKTVLDHAIEEITGEEPNKWLKTAWRSLHRMERQIEEGEYAPEVREFLQAHLHEVYATLKGEQHVVSKTDEEPLKFANERARSVIHNISELLLVQNTEQKEKVSVLTLSLEEILNHELLHGYELRLSQSQETPGVTNLEVYSPVREEWFAFPLPPTDQMMHKGGFPRVILKLMSGAPAETIESELPPNDLDVIAWGPEAEAYATAEKIGVDLSGVEVLKDKSPDYSELLMTRDLDLNSCFIGTGGLVYSEEASEAARTGHVKPIPSYRGIYGTNTFKIGGETLYSGRDMMRAIKFVAEGKAFSFSFKELNQQIDMGIYALVLAEKFLHKPGWEQLLDKTWHLLRQTGQVHADERTVWETLDRLHSEFPFMYLERELPSDSEVSKWLLGKLSKQALHTFRSEHAIPSVLEMERKENDTHEQNVSLKDYVPQPILGSLESIDELARFLDRCKNRNEEIEKSSDLSKPGALAHQSDFEHRESLPELPSRFGNKEAICLSMRSAEEDRGEIRILGDIGELFPLTTSVHGNRVEIAEATLSPADQENQFIPIAITGEDGNSLLYIFKPYEGEGKALRHDCTISAYYPQEEVAYLVSEHFGFDLVPPTIIRKINGQLGSLQLFVDPQKFGPADHVSLMEDETFDALVESDDFMNMALLDALILNADRHQGNYLLEAKLTGVSENNNGNEKKATYEVNENNGLPPRMIAIDHGISMSIEAYQIFNVEGPSLTLSTRLEPNPKNPEGSLERITATIAIPEKQLQLLREGWKRKDSLTDKLLNVYHEYPNDVDQENADRSVSYLLQRVHALLINQTFMNIKNTRKLPEEAIDPLCPHPNLR